MPKQALHSDKVAAPFGVFSQGIEATGKRLLFISGMTAREPGGGVVGKGDIRQQTRQALENLRAVLEAGHASLDDVVKVTVFLTDMAHLMDVHAVRAEYFRPPYPASTLVQVASLVSPDMLIEIEAIAVTG